MILNLITDFIGGVSTVIVLAQPIKKFHDFFIDKRYIKTVLNFKNKECIITQTVYRDSSIKATEVITNASMQAFQMLNNMMYKVNYRIVLNPSSLIGKNIIHIGGPAANIHVNALFVGHNYQFEFWTPESDEKTHKGLNLNSKQLKYSKDNTRKFIVGRKELKIIENERDYAIIIRIPNDEKNGIEYSTHVIFGCMANGTFKGIDFFTNNYKMIAKKYGKSKYCFAVPINLIDNTISVSKERMIDLTNDFFGT